MTARNLYTLKQLLTLTIFNDQLNTPSIPN